MTPTSVAIGRSSHLRGILAQARTRAESAAVLAIAQHRPTGLVAPTPSCPARPEPRLPVVSDSRGGQMARPGLYPTTLQQAAELPSIGPHPERPRPYPWAFLC